MNKRIISLVIMGILAIISIAGLIFAIDNSNKNKDIFANITTSVDKDNISLDIEIEKNEDTDDELQIVEKDSISTYFTITVGGLPDSANRGVVYDSVKGGVISLEKVSFNQSKGTTRFKVTGKNGGQTSIKFLTVSGAREINVTINVNLTAKYVNVAKDAHFGMLKGNKLDLNSRNSLSKLTLYAHEDDKNQFYKPTNYELNYSLKENYQDIILTNGVLSVGTNAIANKEIFVLASVPGMQSPIEIPIYIFDALGEISVTSPTAFTSNQGGVNYYDLILNRENKDSAVFDFAISSYGVVGQDYDFTVQSQNSSIVSVNNTNIAGRRTMFASRNLGDTVIKVTGFPCATMTVNGVANQKVWFNLPSDFDVQVTKDVPIRVKNEFRDQEESILKGQMRFSKPELNAFYYVGELNPYRDEFTIDTIDQLLINYDNLVEFELVITDTNTNSGFQGIYTANSSPIKGTTLKDILDIRVLVNDKWVPIWDLGGSAHYRSKFSVSMLKSSYALPFLGSNITMTLRAKSVSKISTSTANEDKYARCEVPLKGTRAIDEIKVEGLNKNNEIALVYNRNLSTNKPVTVFLSANIFENDQENSDWNPEKLIVNADKLPFDIAISSQGEKQGYTFSVKSNATIEYYVNYPISFTYPNGITKTVNIKVYPFASEISMGMTSDNDGIVYKTIKDPNNPEYIRTVYVRIGATYTINVETPGVTVGAGTSLKFTAESEGLHVVNVTLSAYSDDVFSGRNLNFQVNIVVVNPIRNAVFSESTVKLQGIGAEKYIKLNTTLTQSTSDPYQNLYIKQQISDDNVTVKNLTAQGFTLQANYLTNENVVLGFSVYKKYSYNFDANGDGVIDANDDFDMQYISGTPIKLNVSVENNNSVTDVLLSGDAILSAPGIGKYVTVVSNTNSSTNVEINTIPTNADNGQVGIAFAKWVDGKFVLDYDLNLNSLLSVEFTDQNTRNIRITPVANVKSLGEYGLVIFAKDSMRIVNGKVVPSTYTILPIYIGTAEEIEEDIKEQINAIHDANSGKRNNFGGYNWIVQASDNSKKAALFFSKVGSYQSEIEANRYYLDDLKTVLGWNGLHTEDPFILYKSVDGVQTEIDLGVDNNRKYIQIDEASQVGKEIKYILMNTSALNNSTMEFYAVEGIERFEVSITGSVGLVARKNLSPDGTDISEFENKVSVQRGKYFIFTSNTNTSFASNWKATEYDMSNTGTLSYNGGKYEFVPYIMFGDVKFEVRGLKASIDVTTFGGVDYMSVSQVSSTINGSSAAIYDATVKIDRPWDVSLLDYWFVYNNVSYPLFKNTASSNITTFIPMEGGNAGFLWKLVCTNPNVAKDANGYYTYYLRIDVAIIIESTAVDPFRNIYSAQLILRENLSGLPLVKEPVEKTAYLNILTQGVTNVTFKHFANTVADKETGDLFVAANQTDTSNIYIDKSIMGGVLQVFPTPYYTTVDDIKLASSEYVMNVVIGKDFQGKDIIDQVKYSIGFTQLIYNKNTKTYQTFLSGNTYKMVSSWSAENGYQWDGVYYFKTYLKYDGQSIKRPEDGTKFTLTVTVKSDGKIIKETMTMYARYKDGIIVVPPDTGDTEGDNANPVGTMVQNKHQALGTNFTYDISFPTNYVPNYAGYTIHGDGATYATVSVDEIAKTLSVNLSGNTSAIGKQIEVKIPYKQQGDFVNPYLSVVINPVYFEMQGYEIFNHPENPIKLNSGENSNTLNLRAVIKYNSTLNVDMASKIADFNSVLNNSKLVNRYDDGAGQIIINTTYNYINGVPVISENGDIMREQSFAYISGGEATELSRTENQAIGLTKEYDLDISNRNMLNKIEKSGDDLSKWDAWLTEDGKIDVRLNFDTSLVGKILIIKVYSIYNPSIPEFTLKIEPSYFTYSGYKLKNYPVDPLIALSKPFKLELEANNLEFYNGTGTTGTAVRNAISTFNNELLTSSNLEYSRIVGDTLNFSYNNSTKEVSRIGDVTATSYLKVNAKIKYVNGIPTINNNGVVTSTTFTVKTYGTTVSPEDPDPENPIPPVSPSTRVLSASHAIGKEVRYNIGLANVSYDSQLDKNEKVGAKTEEWTNVSKWNARLDGNYVVVSLDADQSLFGKTLIIYVYTQEDSSTPAYTLHITPSWFTVEGFEILDHPERPIWIISPETISNLKFDVNVSYANIPGIDMEAKVDEFRALLNSSSLVVRSTNGGILSIIVGLSFVNGQPNIIGISEYGAIIVQSSFDYEMYQVMPGPLARDEVQVIGDEVSYLVNLPNGKRIKSIKPMQFDTVSGSWVEVNVGAKWSANTDLNRRVTVKLNATADLINKKLKVEIYNDEGLAFTLNITPAYFVVGGLSVDGQSGQNIWLVTPETPEDLSFVSVVRGNIPSGFGVPAMIDQFNRELKYSDYVTRIYDADSLTGDLRASVFIKYINGQPTITTDGSGIRVDTNFKYTIYSDGGYKPDYPNIPSEARTRTEYQAIGLSARYKIDLSNEVAILNTNLLQGDNWSAKWENDEIVVTIEPNIDLVNTVIKINLYSVFDSSTPIFILTIKPVLFEVEGFEIVGHPERPVRIVSSTENIGSLKYRAVTKHSPYLNISTYLNNFNLELNDVVAMKDSRFFQSIITENRFLTVIASIKYQDSLPTFTSIENYPTGVIENTFEYKIDGAITNSSNHVQAIGTTSRYKIDLDGKVAKHLGNGSGWTATIEGDEVVVTLTNNQTLLNQNVTVSVYDDNGAGLAGDKIFTINIKPVWFEVEGFEVANHPERHMWLVVPEKIANLNLNVVAKYSSDPLLAGNIRTQLNAFNNSLNTNWRNLITRTTMGGEYLTLSGAVVYQNGIASVVNKEDAILTHVVKSVYQYKFYKNDGSEIGGGGGSYPTTPKYTVKAQAIGLTKKYNIDLPDLPSYNLSNIRLTEENSSGVETKWSSFETNGWKVAVVNNQVEVQLRPDSDLLIGKKLRVYIYYSSDNPNPAFILNITPVWFTVDNIAPVGHPEQPIVIENDGEALSNLTTNLVYMAVPEYSKEVAGVEQKIAEFNTELASSPYLTKSISTNIDGKYYLTATTAISYIGGETILSTSPTDVLWNTFEVIIDPSFSEIPEKKDVQGIGTSKTYNIDVSNSLTSKSYSGTGWTANVENNKVTVSLSADVNLIGTEIEINLDGVFILKISPTWFVVEGFEVVGHPERPVWIMAPSATGDLKYRVKTNEIPSGLGIESKIEDFNKLFNESRTTLVSETLKQNKYIMLRAGINYNSQGLPEIVRITNDKRNVVEEIIEYHIWADGKVPVPEQPPVLGGKNVNQIIGGTKSYDLSNVEGRLYFQYMWLNGAGSAINAINSSSVAYQGATVSYNALTNKITVQLAANADYLTNTIEICIPYLVNINNKEVWYSYSLKIKPLLFEVYGWGITSPSFSNSQGKYVYLGGNVNDTYQVAFTAYVNRTQSGDANLQNLITQEIAKLENAVNSDPSLIRFQISDSGIRNFDFITSSDGGRVIKQLTQEDANNGLILSANLSYDKYGIPSAVVSGGSEISSEIKIYTGASLPDPWPPLEGVMLGGINEKQAIGTKVKYSVNIPDAVEIFYDEIWFNDLIINGNSDLINVAYNEIDSSITVDIAPNILLMNRKLEIGLPFTIMENGVLTKYYYSIKIDTVLFLVNGFKLAGYPNNLVDLENQDVVINLTIDATRSDSAAIRNSINLAIKTLEDEINTMIRNNGVTWKVLFPNGEREPNFKVLISSGQLIIQRAGNLTGTGTLLGNINIAYKNGRAVLATEEINDSIPVQVMVSTVYDETPFFPGMSNISRGDNSFVSFPHAIGTSKTYKISTNNANQTFYFRYLEVKNAGPLRGPNGKYEFLDIVWDGGDNLGSISITLKADARLLVEPVEICIPYTEIIEGQIKWYYYSLSIKPVLFEVTGWGIKDGDKIASEIILDDYAIELWFKAKIFSAPLDKDNNQVFTNDDLYFIQESLKALEEQINEYSDSISDKFEYMILHAVPQEGYNVNYKIWRDAETNKTYIQRDILESSKTIIQMSANISYKLNNFDSDLVDSAQAVIGLEEDGQMISGSVDVNTTQKTVEDLTSTVITQENAYLLSQLQANTNYILMSDIYLSKVMEGGWKPASFPVGTTLDGNNYKIFIDGLGFNLSGNPSQIGVFTNVPNTSVIKNVQLVIPSENAQSSNKVKTLELNLQNYDGGAISIGLLAGSNSGIITNCAVLSEWQFMENLYSVNNPITGGLFYKNLKFNSDGYLYDDDYFFQVEKNNGTIKVVKVFNKRGYLLKKDSSNNWVEALDKYGNNIEWITPDKTNIAKYENHSAMINTGESSAKLLVKGTKSNQNITLGGLIGTNANMVTNSRVLIDVELYGPPVTTSSGGATEVSAASAIVGGFVGSNTGTLTSSYFRDGNVTNNAYVGAMGSNVICYLGGFVGMNSESGIIMGSYAMGSTLDRDSVNFISTVGSIKTIRNVLGGFVHLNSGQIKDCMVNMVIDKLGEGIVGGFVYKNSPNASISNCIVNNKVKPMPNGTTDFYQPFIVLNDNMVTTDSAVSYKGLSNLKYAGDRQYSHNFVAVLKWLNNGGEADNEKYSNIFNFEGFSIGEGDGKSEWGVSDKNTIWQMTDKGPALRSANEIAISFKKSQWANSDYLYKPGTEKNPLLIWNKEQFRKYIYEATPQATAADRDKVVQNVEINRQNNHLRMVDNITLDIIPDTYKITYTGTFDGNGLKMDGINLPSVTQTSSSVGLFGKLEYATIRNIKFGLTSSGINGYGIRYVGGVAGISINTNYVDVTIDATNTATVLGANIVGGIAGLTVITDSDVENFNVISNVSATARRNSGVAGPGDRLFSSGLEYYQQTLYAINKSNIEQGYGVAGGVFGFVTSNPNNYKKINSDGKEEVVARSFEGLLNQDASMFLKDKDGKVIKDNTSNGLKYNTDPITLRKVGGAVKNVTANVAGGLIGIMDETIELKESKLTELKSLTGKYYLGGLVGINLGKITGGSVEINNFNANSVVTNNPNGNFIFRASESVDNPIRFWGMTIGAVAAYNDGIPSNSDSGVIVDTKVNVNMLGSNAKNIYVIGGVVGVNGDNGYVDPSVINARYPIESGTLANPSQWQNIGFYFGNVVGRGNVNVDPKTGEILSFSGFENTKLDLVRKETVDIGDIYFASPSVFKTPGFILNGKPANAFGVDNWKNYNGDIVTSNPYTGTRKVQTFTMEEYKAYINYIVASGDVMERVKALEVLYRTLPTQFETVMIDGKSVAVEKVEESYLVDFQNWIKEKQIFERNISVDLKNTIFEDYKSYIKYSAMGESLEWFAENGNLKNSRTERYNSMIEFFTYKTKLIGGVAGTQNAGVTWDDYQNYIKFRDNATNKNTTQAERDEHYNNNVEKWLYPYQEFVEYKVDEAGVTEEIRISSNKDFLVLKNNTGIVKFSANDPLQAYINYFVPYTITSGNKKIVHESMFQRGLSWTMSLPQYYYYINNVMPNKYGTSRGFYTAEEYADYLYTNYNLYSDGVSSLITLNNYMDFLRNERENVMAYEKQWVISGHIIDNKRVGKIGGEYMGWADVWDTTAKENVKDDGNMIYFDENGDGVPDGDKSWDATTKYFTAKESSLTQLDFAKYMRIRSLGGSLYELDDGDYTADSYIFYLTTPQFGWTNDQIKFIQNAFGETQNQYALAATYTGDVFALDDLRGARAINTQVDGTWDEEKQIWFIDKNGNGKYDPTEESSMGTWKFSAGDGYFRNGTDAYYALRDIDLTKKVKEFKDEDGNVISTKILEGPALYLDGASNGETEGDKIFSKGSSNDRLVIYQVGTADDADFKKVETVGEVDTITGYYKISRYIVEDMNLLRTPNDDKNVELTKNRTDYLEEALWWYKQGFDAKQFSAMKIHAMQGQILKGQVEIVLSNEHTQLKVERKPGYMIADDWYQVIGNRERGFKIERTPNEFKPENYVDIVLNSNWVEDRLDNGVLVETMWYSNYADYLLLKELINIGTNKVTVGNFISLASLGGDLGLYGENLKYINYPDTEKLYALNFVSPDEYADIIDVAGSGTPKAVFKDLYMRMAKTNGSIADFVDWASKPYNIVTVKVGSETTEKMFKLNHYIYAIENSLSESESEDFKWVLKRSNRSKLLEGTQERKTSDLMIYRRDWYANGNNYMTLTEYCEWINEYKYNDNYKGDKGDGAEGIQDGWLNINSFAVWKRMEKYESTTNIRNKNPNLNVEVINSPVLKRRISTTIMPMDHRSRVDNDNVNLPSKLNNGNAYYRWTNVIKNKLDSLRAELFGEVLVLVKNTTSQMSLGGGPHKVSDFMDMFDPNTWDCKGGYDWIKTGEGPYASNNAYSNDSLFGRYKQADKDKGLDPNTYWSLKKEYEQKFMLFYKYFSESLIIIEGVVGGSQLPVSGFQRPWEDRYEYNETVVNVSVKRLDASSQSTIGRQSNKVRIAQLIDLSPDSTEDNCDDFCGGNGILLPYCKNPNHNLYQVQLWQKRYGLNETDANFNISGWATFGGKKYNLILDEQGGAFPTMNYSQLYIRHETFRNSALNIKNNYLSLEGYNNFMKYWAKNGEWNWVYNIGLEYAGFNGSTAGKFIIEHGYTDKSFWDTYDGTKSPLDGKKIIVNGQDTKAVGW